MSLIYGLLQNSIGLLFFIIAMGILVGRIPLWKFKLGGSGVLLVGLIFGHFGFLIPKDIQTIGVVLFVYSVGLKAGPYILKSLQKSKGHFFLIATLIVSTAGGLGLFLHHVFGISSELITGIYAGALTSTPALAAAMETVGNSTPSVGYGLAYPLGIIGVILMVQLLPIIFRVNLKEEEQRYKKSLNIATIERRTFKVTNPNITKSSIAESLSDQHHQFRIVRVQRGKKIFTPHSDFVLKLNDIVLVVGKAVTMGELKVLLGESVNVTVPESDGAASNWISVSSKSFIGKKLGQMEISSLYGIIITRVRRGGVEFMPNTNFVFEAGDEIRVSGEPKDLRLFTNVLEQDPESVHDTDILTLMIGLVFGIVLGLIKIPVSDQLSVGLGIAGGPLIAGLILGHFGRFGSLSGRVPKAAQMILGDLGLYLFLAVAGCFAGEHFVEILKQNGPILILAGFLITLVPIIVTAFIARYLFRMNTLIILGMLCGGMTSTPALGVLASNTKSDIPALAYTGIYPIAVVFTTLMAQILVLF